MTTTLLRRTLTTPPPYLRLFSTTPPPPPHPHPKTQTPQEKQFETWVNHLKPGFTPSHINQALTSQPDPDLAFDIFRWATLRRTYKHDPSTYLTMIQISVTNRRHLQAQTLLEEILAGACPINLPLCNSLIKFCCSHKCLFTKSFDVYKKMIKEKDCRPDLDTYKMLFQSLLRRFSKLNVCYVYINAVCSLTKQMKTYGVIPDVYVLNMIIKAYVKCLRLDEAVRVFREMGLYGCEANEYSYSYLVKGCVEKGRVGSGLRFYDEMRGKGFVCKSSCCMVLVCGLSLERRFEDSVRVLRDMLGDCVWPDLLTYRTLLEELCRVGKGEEAFELLEEFRKKDVSMNERSYKTLLDSLHFVDRD